MLLLVLVLFFNIICSMFYTWQDWQRFAFQIVQVSRVEQQNSNGPQRLYLFCQKHSSIYNGMVASHIHSRSIKARQGKARQGKARADPNFEPPARRRTWLIRSRTSRRIVDIFHDKLFTFRQKSLSKLVALAWFPPKSLFS